ncbi:MAG TPA: hypothetical protein PK079_20490 [Leptospiraceae bacterium]|nr:hypothetical protein [Leptospiraceae bacterium]HMW03640.1 hypothetical protein [Leptospiraceae bacterium]HMX31233.1 hypothetical protein [Leptospiraceae bacterium]HMY29439.1 hypothetical protein [Leptospiraceae bacterium]HMZ67538.1 hypothetical protein [Leptospiraceae bacterium]
MRFPEIKRYVLNLLLSFFIFIITIDVFSEPIEIILDNISTPSIESNTRLLQKSSHFDESEFIFIYTACKSLDEDDFEEYLYNTSRFIFFGIFYLNSFRKSLDIANLWFKKYISFCEYNIPPPSV